MPMTQRPPPPRRPAARALATRAHVERGFTLVEAVISAALLGLLAVTASYFVVDNLRLVRLVNDDSAAMADGRAALERLAREVREIKLARSTNSYCIVGAPTATQLVFNRTIGLAPGTACGGANPDATQNDMAVTIQWVSNTSTINLGYAGAMATAAAGLPPITRTVTGQASNFSFAYLDQNLAATISTTAIRYVRMTLTTRPPGQRATTTSTMVALRNE